MEARVETTDGTEEIRAGAARLTVDGGSASSAAGGCLSGCDGALSSMGVRAETAGDAEEPGAGAARLAADDGSPLLVSACLLGVACRYDGASFPCPEVRALADSCELVPVCPEQLGGLPTPRTPSEIQPDGRVVDRDGVDRTAAFFAGAREALRIAQERGCTQAVLKSKSPSCGVHRIYDGTFTGTVIPGQGVTAALLDDAGIRLFEA